MEELGKQMKAEKAGSTGMIRWSAVIPFSIFSILVSLYFHFFFDTHLRLAFELIGYHVAGAEVNIGKVQTSFFRAKIEIKKVEITDAENPDVNSLEIGDIRYGMVWDGLLRARIIIDEIAVEQIAFGTKRTHRGKVKPPAPPSQGPSTTDILANEAIELVQDQYSDNVLGDIANVLKGGDAQAEFQKIQSGLPSKAMIEALQKNFKGKQETWKVASGILPKSQELQALGDRLSKIKTKDFKTPQELQDSLREFEVVMKELDLKLKSIQSFAGTLQTDFQDLDKALKDLDKQIKIDLQTLQARLRIPKLEPKVLAKALFGKYLQPYLNKIDKYKKMAYQYIPPNLLKKDEQQGESANSLMSMEVKPHPRQKGVTYEFGKPGSYPLFWLKRTNVSSKAGVSPGAGNIQGEILDITSNQKLITRPTIFKMHGDFPDSQIRGLESEVILDATKAASEIIYKFSIAEIPLLDKVLVDSGEVNLQMKSAQSQLDVTGSLIGFRDLKFKLINNLNDMNCVVSAKDPLLGDILKNIFKDVRKTQIHAEVNGTLPRVDLAITSNLGNVLEEAFNKELQNRIKELQSRIQRIVEEEVGKHRAEVEKQILSIRSQLEGELKKNQQQLEGQKRQIEAQIENAKKDAENQARNKLKEAEKSLQNQLGTEGQKQLDDLKKKFGI